MVESKTLEAFSYYILKKFMEVTDSNFGVFFTLDREKEIFKCTGSIGANIELMESFKADIFEGEIGPALAERKISHITNIPPDTIFKFKTFVGTVIPKDILTIPILIDDEPAAVISLASLKPYSQESLEITNHVWLSLNTAFSNLLAGINTAKLAEDLQEKNKEITLINEELKNQTEELKIQRLQVAEADRLKSEFLSNMSHELRTPLNSIMALSRLMISKGTGINPGKEKENLIVIERNGRILLELINGILDLAKIEAGRVDVNLTGFKPERVVTASIDIIRPMAQSKGLSLAINIENNPHMYSDGAKIQQILFNLLSNAAKFTKKGEIGITVTSPGDMIYFAVRDTGIGIKSRDLPYIFDEFRQGDGSSSREFEGVGLGLAISRKFARLLGGDITVESKWGKGSVFTLSLPLRGREKKENLSYELDDIRQQDSDREVIAGEPPRILILVVEDDPDNRYIITSILDDADHPYITAINGEEAVSKAKESLPGLILMDIQLPLLSGLDAAKQIKAEPKLADVPVIALTAKAMKGDKEKMLSASCDDYISKPIDPETLLEVIQKWLD
jgi:signal transduction histidine kinase/CheY-like chemotaxis protein